MSSEGIGTNGEVKRIRSSVEKYSRGKSEGPGRGQRVARVTMNWLYGKPAQLWAKVATKNGAIDRYKAWVVSLEKTRGNFLRYSVLADDKLKYCKNAYSTLCLPPYLRNGSKITYNISNIT